jgi:hypothetical protein
MPFGAPSPQSYSGLLNPSRGSAGASRNTRPGSEFAFQFPSDRTPSMTSKFLDQLFEKESIPHYHEYRALSPHWASYEPHTLRMLPSGMDAKVF